MLSDGGPVKRPGRYDAKDVWLPTSTLKKPLSTDTIWVSVHTVTGLPVSSTMRNLKVKVPFFGMPVGSVSRP